MDPFIGEIRMFAGDFAPYGHAFCNGQLLPIAQNSALFAVLGITYGGDGQTTFAVPNLQGRAPMHQGMGPGLTQRRLGEAGGSATVTLTQSQVPAHTHVAQCNSGVGAQTQAPANVWGAASGRGQVLYTDGALDKPMSPAAITSVGGSQPHNNMQPYVAINFIIATMGIFPVRD